MHHVPMCTVCGEWEVGTFKGSTQFCSEACENTATQEVMATPEWQAYDPAGDGWGYDDIMAMYDDDPNPYAGTYSED